MLVNQYRFFYAKVFKLKVLKLTTIIILLIYLFIYLFFFKDAINSTGDKTAKINVTVTAMK